MSGVNGLSAEVVVPAYLFVCPAGNEPGGEDLPKGRIIAAPFQTNEINHRLIEGRPLGIAAAKRAASIAHHRERVSKHAPGVSQRRPRRSRRPEKSPALRTAPADRPPRLCLLRHLPNDRVRDLQRCDQSCRSRARRNECSGSGR